MPDIYAPRLSGPVFERGYTGKGQVTVQDEGQLVKVPVAQIKIVPPQGGTAAVKKPQK
jgi:hypothetical protein